MILQQLKLLLAKMHWNEQISMLNANFFWSSLNVSFCHCLLVLVLLPVNQYHDDCTAFVTWSISHSEWHDMFQMIRGSHRSGRVAQHTCCVDDTWYVSIDEHEIETQLGMSHFTTLNIVCFCSERAVLALRSDTRRHCVKTNEYHDAVFIGSYSPYTLVLSI